MNQQAGTVADMIRRNAAAIPGSPAVVGEGRNVTYGELGERSDRIASGLVSAGLRTGDRRAVHRRAAAQPVGQGAQARGETRGPWWEGHGRKVG